MLNINIVDSDKTQSPPFTTRRECEKYAHNAVTKIIAEFFDGADVHVRWTCGGNGR